MRTLSILMTDFYKFAHQGQYDPSINQLVSYGTPRGCRLPGKDYVINFGIQSFCKEYLIDHFNRNFFHNSIESVSKELTYFLTNCFPGSNVAQTVWKIAELHKLGYLPISLRTIPEGCKVSLGCPNIEIVTTVPGFQWVGGFIESLMSSYIWKPMICATVGHWYRETANKFFEMTADNWESKARSSMSEFGFRGADTPEDGIHSGAAWLLSFDKTATCAAIPFVNRYYNVVFPGTVMDVTSFFNLFCNSHSELNKSNNLVEEFMRANENWNLDSTDEDERPEWVIPEDEWNNDYIKFSINGKLISIAKNGRYLSPFSEFIVGKGLISTEHSVMCSSTQLYMNEGLSQKEAEKKYVKELLTEIYPNSSFSMVSDSYDYWRLVTEILPELKDEIMNHNGTLFVRGDSGDPVKIVAGYIDITDRLSQDDLNDLLNGKATSLLSLLSEPLISDLNILYLGKFVSDYCYVRSDDGKMHRLDYDDIVIEFSLGKELPRYEAYGTVSILAEIFGTTLNSKGYSVLDPHIRAIYGDSITPKRQEMIYAFLKYKGLSVENVALGAGSFSFHAYQDEKGTLYPYTRDTYQFAQKATYGKTEDGLDIMIYKDPKTDSDHFKKSMKGCCAVYFDSENLTYYLDHDGLTIEERDSDRNNGLIEVFRDGVMIHEDTFKDVRDRLNDNKF